MRLIHLLATVSMLGLAACEAPRMADFDPHHRFQNKVAKRHAMASVSPGQDGQSLTPADRAVIADLAREHLRRGAGSIQVRISSGGAVESTRGFADRIAFAFSEYGIGPADLDIRLVEGTGTIVADIRTPIWVADVPECGVWPERIGSDYQNQNTANFGCAVTRNIGLMVGNPADLERARAASARSGARADDVLTKYGEGKPTASKTEEYKPPTLSTVGTK